MTDTDSLVYEIETEDIYEYMISNKELYDFSDYLKDHPCYDETNKKVIGKMKDEFHGEPIVEFVGLRSKMYSILQTDSKETKRAKGVPKPTVSKNIHHHDYKRTLFREMDMYTESISIQPIKHQLYTLQSNKKSLFR